MAFVCVTPAAAAPCLRIATAPGIGATGEITDIVQHVFEKAGLCVNTIRLPPNRISVAAQDGSADGWAMEISGAEDLTSWVALPTDLAQFEGELYWPQRQNEPKGPRALLGIVLGQPWAERAVSEHGARLMAVRDNRQLLEMAQKNRLQGFLIPSITFRHFLPQFPELTDFQHRTVATLPVRIVLAPRHAANVEALDRAVRETLAEGFADRVWRKYAP